ncbi:adenosine deaminase [Paracoccus sp. (in: a-proteobacteria)]|uniref:adenosine deaminase n=1 Tax=Paracoccus sp. TaxID=267 RepID=UPI002897A8D0|nr:adenosine deaminase [Paracoccus sp. (in: a-proteobacteria)]
MKKTELHLHLEGAAPPAFVRALAKEKRIDLPRLFDDKGNYAYRDFFEFLRLYESVTSLLTSPRDYARLLGEVLSERAEDGVIYCEIFIAPDFCGGGDLYAWQDHVAAMTEVAHSFRAQGIECRAIATAVRHFGQDQSKRAARCAAETSGGWCTGFGMGGAETVGSAEDHAWAFDCAREAGLGLTCHAGEWAGPQSIREALRLGVTRLGHGVRAVEDPALMRDLADRAITLECCPGSNLALGIYPDWHAHPIARLADAGVRVTISTDDPPFFKTTLRQEYERLAEAFSWHDEDFRRMNLWAIEAAFCDTDTKTRLQKELS